MKKKFENTIIDEYILNIGGSKVNVNVAKYIGFETRRIADKNVIIYIENGNKDNKVVVVDGFVLKEINTSKHITDKDIEKMISDYEKETTDTELELLKDDVGEYIKLKKRFNDRWIDISFYIDEIDFNKKEDIVYAINPSGTKLSIPDYNWDVNFKCKKDENGSIVKTTMISKQMTKEEIEKKLGYKIDIIN